MLFIFAEIIGVSILLRKQRKVHSVKALMFSFLVQTLILISYILELREKWGRIVYWSDAEYYWNATLEMLNGVVPSVYNIGYVFYSWLLQLTSPIVTPIWNNVSNLILLNLSFLLGIQMIMGEVKQKFRRLPWFSYLVTIGNPLVIYSLCRNLKDVLFLFYTVLSIYVGVKLMQTLVNSRIRLSRNIPVVMLSISSYLLSFSALLSSVRVWGWMIPTFNVLLITSALALSSTTKKRFKWVLIPLLSVILFVPYFTFSPKVQQISFWIESRENLVQMGRQMSALQSVLVGPFVMFFGPGPIRSLFGSTYFQFYTHVGNVSSFLGSVVWYFFLPWFGTNLLRRLRWSAKFVSFKMTAFILLLLLGIYSYFYGGSTELRFRGVLYVLTGLVYVAVDWAERDIPKRIIVESPLFYIGLVLNLVAVVLSL
ncbi:MAG: hypothetical protein XD57_1286 [Thermotoga petrophila]|uniref:Glycosyltransferase RgtA/B/C/D-like domain-containing protein n=1 Tax=Thermotoga petrophila TaxID=93929 RepID=A0A101EPP0_9THEM|nr:MAG: hypothetical protein XD57_1286 [Thermotoga petrophila]